MLTGVWAGGWAGGRGRVRGWGGWVGGRVCGGGGLGAGEAEEGGVQVP